MVKREIGIIFDFSEIYKRNLSRIVLKVIDQSDLFHEALRYLFFYT